MPCMHVHACTCTIRAPVQLTATPCVRLPSAYVRPSPLPSCLAPCNPTRAGYHTVAHHGPTWQHEWPPAPCLRSRPTPLCHPCLAIPKTHPPPPKKPHRNATLGCCQRCTQGGCHVPGWRRLGGGKRAGGGGAEAAVLSSSPCPAPEVCSVSFPPCFVLLHAQVQVCTRQFWLPSSSSQRQRGPYAPAWGPGTNLLHVVLRRLSSLINNPKTTRCMLPCCISTQAAPECPPLLRLLCVSAVLSAGTHPPTALRAAQNATCEEQSVFEALGGTQQPNPHPPQTTHGALSPPMPVCSALLLAWDWAGWAPCTCGQRLGASRRCTARPSRSLALARRHAGLRHAAVLLVPQVAVPVEGHPRGLGDLQAQRRVAPGGPGHGSAAWWWRCDGWRQQDVQHSRCQQLAHAPSLDAAGRGSGTQSCFLGGIS